MKVFAGFGRVMSMALLVALATATSSAAAQEQMSDPGFDASVAHPAYATGTGPRVLFDEAHFNFHTAGGRYKAFADLLTHDGYRISPNRERFSHDALRRADLLVIANALGAADAASADAGKPAFTEEEARAVAEWVRTGGALLLITDHQPTGAAARTLAASPSADSPSAVQRTPTAFSSSGPRRTTSTSRRRNERRRRGAAWGSPSHTDAAASS